MLYWVAGCIAYNERAAAAPGAPGSGPHGDRPPGPPAYLSTLRRSLSLASRLGYDEAAARETYLQQLKELGRRINDEKLSNSAITRNILNYIDREQPGVNFRILGLPGEQLPLDYRLDLDEAQELVATVDEALPQDKMRYLKKHLSQLTRSLTSEDGGQQ